MGNKEALTQYPDGQSQLIFDKLPAGDYEVEMIYSWYKIYHPGTMPYRVLAYAKDQEIDLVTAF